jgi:peptidoglycan-associated lipoprotein
MFKHGLKIVLLTAALAALSACSTTGTGASSNAGDATTDSGAVQTAGLGGDDGLSNPNAMVPGANQRYFFDLDKSDVHSSDLPSIKVQSQYLISHPSAAVRIEGNTDIRGSHEYNMALGQRRADAVKKVFLLNGASSGQLKTISFGAEKPVALGNTENDYAKNRRADVNYTAH